MYTTLSHIAYRPQWSLNVGKLLQNDEADVDNNTTAHTVAYTGRLSALSVYVLFTQTAFHSSVQCSLSVKFHGSM